ncbi:hypothetical protein KSS87_011904 [Heliosperma pusillum]|nr:hypothetical protein KSS87_021100 [Heliosperma pusillum]KAH9614258.1 hypothetical protein KSS87_011904 [Heliosperma pusillum]
MKQGRLIVHTRSSNATMGNEARKTHSSHKELQCNKCVMKQGRLIVHTRSYNATMGNEARKTHCSHKELQCNNG